MSVDLYTKPVQIVIKSNPNVPGEQQTNVITIKISSNAKPTTRSKSLQVQLTDESDPFFLYQLEITEEEFHVLKSEQTLLIDFAQFPYKVIELLEHCIASSLDPSPKYFLLSRFVAQLIQDPVHSYGSFSIVETNSFKHINHLTLKFTPGTDYTTKQYLALVVKDLKSEKSKLETTVATLETRLEEVSKENGKLMQVVEELKLSQSRELSSCKLQHAKELSMEKEKYMAERESERIQRDHEIRSLQSKYDLQVKEVSEKLHQTTLEGNSLSRLNEKVQKEFDSLKIEYSKTRSELERVRLEYERTYGSKASQDQTISSMEAKISSLSSVLREMEKREKDAIDQATKSTERMELITQQLVHFTNQKREEESIEMYKHTSSQLEAALKKTSEEINKANDIIRRLQGDLKNAKSKLKLKSLVTVQQEKLLDERLQNMETLQVQVEQTKSNLKEKENQVEKLKSEVVNLKQLLEESKKTIADNNHVIEWLHKQLNEEALHRPLTTFSKLSIDPVPTSSQMPPTIPTSKSPTRDEYDVLGAHKRNVGISPYSSLPGTGNRSIGVPNSTGRSTGISTANTRMSPIPNAAFTLPLSKPSATAKSNYF